MAGRSSFLLAAALVTLTLAGCASGSDDDGSTSGQDPGLQPAGFDEGTGGLDGLVIDDESAPIAGANAGLLELGLQTSSNGEGRFAFSNVAPGTYALAVQALGYDSTAQQVSIVAGEVASLTVELRPLPKLEPYYLVLGPWDGFFNLRIGTPIITGLGGTPQDTASFNFTMEDRTVAFVGEMRWDQATAGTSTNLRMSFSHVGRMNTHWFCSNTGPSPLQWIYVMEDQEVDKSADEGCYTQRGDGEQTPGGQPQEPTTDMTLLTYVNTPFGGTSADNPPVYVTAQQRFEAVVTIFQDMLPPEGYSAFPDQ